MTLAEPKESNKIGIFVRNQSIVVPILKSPTLKPTVTANPAKTSGVVFWKVLRSPSESNQASEKIAL